MDEISNTEESTYEFLGSHYFASFVDCNHEKIINIGELKKILFTAIQSSGASILNHVEHFFDNNGYTCVILLSESHCSIHTYPEHNSFYIDLFTCGTSCNSHTFRSILNDYFEPKIIRENNIQRF